ncbi:hypothetical protein LCGC14_0582300 [marine sediment metagenome]|uniref:Uncharacterized protein n=1 Tax=marine sediment metagenome TaxID=412755 RepID=A0A0F9RG42_9ZZZZ
MAEQLGTPVKLDLAPGVYSDETPSGAMGTWKDCDLIRFKNSLCQSLGGWKKKTLTGDAILGVPRSAHDWSALDATKYLAVGTEKRLYIIQTSLVATNITPIRATASPSGPFGTNTDGDHDPNGSSAKYFTFTDPANHGCTLGDIVEFDSYTSPVGGIVVNGSFEVVEVTSSTVITLKGAEAASSTVVGGGSTGNVTYEITSGSGAAGFVLGYGTGPYGAETYGNPRTVSTFVTETRKWSLGNWGEDLIASPRGGKIYQWDKSNGVGTRAQEITEAPATNLSVIVSPENRQLIAFGAHTDTTDDSLFIRWCDNEDFTTWTSAADNNAGTKRLDSGSEIVAGIRSRIGVLVLTDTSVHVMQPISGNEIYAFREIASGISIAGPSAGVDAHGIVYFMGISNFYIYDGTLRVLPCPNWTRVYDSFNIDQSFSVFCSHSKDFNEIWWFYPSEGKFSNDRYIVYNYVEKIWYYGDMDRQTFHDYSPFFKKPFGFDAAGNLYAHEDGVDADESAMVSFIESSDMSIEEGDELMHVSRLIPDFDRIAGSVEVLLKGRKQPQREQFTKGPYIATGATSEMGVRIRARYLALRITQEGIGESFRMGSWRARMQKDGER